MIGARNVRVLLAALVLPLGGLGRADDASQLQVICAIFASGTRRRSLPSVLHVVKLLVRTRMQNLRAHPAGRPPPSHGDLFASCARPGALDRRAATERSWGCNLWSLRPILTFRGTPRTAALPWCVCAQMRLACLHASAHVRTLSDHSTHACPYASHTAPRYRTCVVHACMRVNTYARMNSCLHTHSCTQMPSAHPCKLTPLRTYPRPRDT